MALTCLNAAQSSNFKIKAGLYPGRIKLVVFEIATL
jgi:hypothetical protein